MDGKRGFSILVVINHSDHRYYVPLRLPPARLRVVRFSLSLPDTLLCPSFVVCVSASADSPRRRGLLGGTGISPSGRTSSLHLFSLRRETDGPPKFPGHPRERMAPVSDPGGVLIAGHDAFRTAAFRSLHSVGFPPRFPEALSL